MLPLCNAYELSWKNHHRHHYYYYHYFDAQQTYKRNIHTLDTMRSHAHRQIKQQRRIYVFESWGVICVFHREKKQYGCQCTCNHGPGRFEEANREHEVSGFNGTLAFIEKYCRVSFSQIYLIKLFHFRTALGVRHFVSKIKSFLFFNREPLYRGYSEWNLNIG